MPRLHAAVLPVLVAAGQWGCSTGNSPAAPSSVTLRVTVQTQGPTPDTDGYLLYVDGAPNVELPTAGTRSISLSPGGYEVALGGLQVNCSVTGSASLQVQVAGSSPVDVSFSVRCPRALLDGFLFARRFINGTDQATVRSFDTGAEVNLFPDESVFRVDLSPDGTQLLGAPFEDGPNPLFVMNADGTDRRQVADDAPLGAQWLDRDRFAFAARPGVGMAYDRIMTGYLDGRQPEAVITYPNAADRVGAVFNWEVEAGMIVVREIVGFVGQELGVYSDAGVLLAEIELPDPIFTAGFLIPGQNRLVFSTERETFSAAPDGGEVTTEYTAREGYTSQVHDVSADGARILLVEQRRDPEGSGIAEIVEFALGSGVTTVLLSEPFDLTGGGSGNIFLFAKYTPASDGS